MKGVSEIPSSVRRNEKGLAIPIEQKYGNCVSDDTASVVERLHSAVDAKELVQATKQLSLDELDSYNHLFDGWDADLDEDPDLGAVMSQLDVKLTESLAPRDIDASKVSKKGYRESIYVPELINRVGSDGTIYMAKTLSTSAKVRMAHDLHDDNEVVVVDNYEKWENIAGWEKLKQFPHGKNQIREELGDKLSDEVLDLVAGESETSTDTETKSDSSGGRRTRTKPTDETLNIAIDSGHKSRFKIVSEDIVEGFDDDGQIGNFYNSVEMLVLFPTTTDLNMTNHWWVAGKRWPDGGNVAIANCNKGTFEYLNQRDEVWHIEDYLEQAGDYEFETNHGLVTMDTVEHSSLVFHVLDEQTRSRVMAEPAFSHMPEMLPKYCEEEMYRSPEFPHPDDMLYAPISQEDVFWLRPQLIEQNGDDSGIILYADSSPRNVGTKHSLSSDYKLYARARLHNWDFDSVEMERLDRANHYLGLNDGGYEVVQTLAMLHDQGKEPFSNMPQSRWDQ